MPFGIRNQPPEPDTRKSRPRSSWERKRALAGWPVSALNPFATANSTFCEITELLFVALTGSA